jgi:alcohol dehydrogenase class IV
METPMIPFSFEMPGLVHFGPGALRKLGESASPLGRRILVVSGTGWLARSGVEARIRESLEDRVVGSLRCPPGEPTCGSLEQDARQAADFRPDGLLAVGGGSVLDTAKALSALLRSPGPVERFLEGVPGSRPVPDDCLPWVAVPTTAGTGSEATKNAVVRIERLGVKRSMRSARLLARAVLVDPELTLTLPAEITGASGLDALTQLVEAFLSRASTPFVRALVADAFPRMLDALDGLPGAPADIGLRSEASYGALVSGIALANAGLGAAHGFAAAIGGECDVPHGLACAVLLPHVLEANRAAILDPLQGLVEGCRGLPRGCDPVAWLAGKVRGLLGAFGLPEDLREYGIGVERIPELAEKASGSSMRGNPRELSMEERRLILARVLGPA